jgi:5-methylcytosine-specific restriction endonuclease McrA
MQITCEVCKTEFKARSGNQKYCRNCNYGVNLKQTKASYKKSSDAVKKLRKLADRLLQEKYTQGLCLVCGAPASCVHHYVPKSQSNNLRYDPSNLIPICRGCHFSLHTKGDPHIQNTIEKIRGQK